VLVGSRARVTPADTQADGSFELTAGQPGTYVVTANGDDHTHARMTVEVTADTDAIDVVLQDPGGIRGLVTLAGGASAPNATIAVEGFVREGDTHAPPRGRAKARTLGAADGTFSLPELLPGTYDLVITAPGRADAHVAGVVVHEGGWADVAVTLAEEPS
jgi:hypothetical protein